MLVVAATGLCVRAAIWILFNASYFRWTTWRARRAARVHRPAPSAEPATEITR
jgi:hypothetical protein